MEAEPPETKDRYSMIIQIAAWTGAIFVGLLSVAALFVTMTDDDGDRPPIAGFLMMPVGGYLMGMAAAVLFAPTSYLEGPGKQWVEKIGTKSIKTARIVALVFTLIAMAFFGFLLAALLTNNFKN